MCFELAPKRMQAVSFRNWQWTVAFIAFCGHRDDGWLDVSKPVSAAHGNFWSNCWCFASLGHCSQECHVYFQNHSERADPAVWWRHQWSHNGGRADDGKILRCCVRWDDRQQSSGTPVPLLAFRRLHQRQAQSSWRISSVSVGYRPDCTFCIITVTMVFYSNPCFIVNLMPFLVSGQPLLLCVLVVLFTFSVYIPGSLFSVCLRVSRCLFWRIKISLALHSYHQMCSFVV